MKILFLLSAWGTFFVCLCLGCIGQMEEMQKKSSENIKRMDTEAEAIRRSIIESCQGEKLVRVINHGKYVVFIFENGKSIAVHSISHHSAGSHCEITR